VALRTALELKAGKQKKTTALEVFFVTEGANKQVQHNMSLEQGGRICQL
jgi:hypothetical protein